MGRLIRFVIVTVAVAALLWIIIAGSTRAVRWARKGSPAAAFIGWAMLLFGPGMTGQPPPQEQIEEANREKKLRKDAEAGDPPEPKQS